MNLILLALLWAAASGVISLVAVHLFLGCLISRSCAFVTVPAAISFVLLTAFQKAAMGFNVFYLISLTVVVSVIMLLISLAAINKTDFQQESFWKSVNILSFIIIVVFSQVNFGTQVLDQILFSGYMIETYGYIFWPLIILSGFLSFYLSPQSKSHMFPWWFVILTTSIVVMSFFLTGGFFSLALVVSVPCIVAKEGMGFSDLNLRAMVAGIFFGLSAIAFNLASGIPSALGGTLIVYAFLAVVKKGR